MFPIKTGAWYFSEKRYECDVLNETNIALPVYNSASDAFSYMNSFVSKHE